MKCNLAVFKAMFLVFISFGVCPMYADDHPDPVQDTNPKLVKKGAMPSEDRWKEEDVKKYLALPYITSTNDDLGASIVDIASKLEAVQKVGSYQIGKDKNRSLKLNIGSGEISFDLREKDMSVFYVTVHDGTSWNSACDKLFINIISTVEMWNKIPEHYKVQKSKDTYVMYRSGKNPQKWHFDLKKRFVISVYSKTRKEDAQSNEDAVAQIDQVIWNLDAIIKEKE